MKSKYIAAACSAVMAVTSLCYAIPVGAVAPVAPTSNTSASSSSQNTTEAEMKTALTLAKSRIKIPDDYTKFSYSSSKSRGVNCFYFTWTKPTGDSIPYSVTVKGDMITNYSAPSEDYSSTPSFGKFTPAEYASKAVNWINSVMPEAKGFIVRDGSCDIYPKRQTVSLRFKRVCNGIDVKNNYINITLDKKTGEVTGMYCSWWQNASFKSSSKALSQSDIKKIYKKDTELGLAYRLSYDIETEKYTATAVYSPKTFMDYDAFNGKLSTMDADRSEAMNTEGYSDDVMEEVCEEEEISMNSVAATGVAPESPKVELTEEELSALDEFKGLLTAGEFKKLMIKDPYIKVTDKYLTDRYRVYKNDSAESGYMIEATFIINTKTENCTYNISADAKSGKVYSFYRYSSTDSNKLISPAKDSKTAEAAAKYYCSGIFSKYKADPENTAPAEKTKYYTESNRNYRFNRYENNIIVEGNSINIGVNSDGIVTRMSCNHTEDVDFGSGKILSKAKAFDSLFSQLDMELYYDGFLDLKSAPHTYLIYTMPSWEMNAETGKLLERYAVPYRNNNDDTPEECPYTDISASPYKNEIITLYNNGVRVFTDKKLSPTEKITTEELRALLGSVNGGRYDIMPLDYTNGSSQNGNAAKPQYVTRLSLAEQFVNSNGYEAAARLKGIYKSPFKDISDNDANVGVISIAYAIGAADADAKGNFNGGSYVTREYAMHCIYNYIMTLNK